MFHSWKESQCLQTTSNFKHHCLVSHHFTQFTIPALGPRTSNPSSNIAWAGGVASGLCWQERRAEISRRQRGVMSCRNRGALIAANLQVSVSNSELCSKTFTVDPIFCGVPLPLLLASPFSTKKTAACIRLFLFFSERHPINLPTYIPSGFTNIAYT